MVPNITVSAMLPHLGVNERQEQSTMLESASSRSGSGPVPLVVQETGIIIPPVNFLNIPLCRLVTSTVIIFEDPVMNIAYKLSELLSSKMFISNDVVRSCVKNIYTADWKF